jgi:excinuclease ABC subunit C
VCGFRGRESWPPAQFGVGLQQAAKCSGHTGRVTSALPGRPGSRRPPAVPRLPAGPGVYRFRDARGRVLYVGRATTLRSRVGSYWSDLRGRRHLTRMVAQVDRIEAVACGSVHEAAWLERNLLETSMPRWNRTRGGQENQVYIRLSRKRPGRALTVVYQPLPAADVQYFGPYLGGVRARQAVTALGRIRPAAGAGAALRGAQLDLARVRGHDPAARDADLDTLAAVLAKEPAAVAQARAELTSLRDRAAGQLAFEFAARVQTEIESLDWITDPQRVTSMDPEDFNVYGWAGGTLVHFGVRGGRLCQWSQRPCPDRAAAEPGLAATPASWAAFATANAELAATLAGAVALAG